MMSPSPLDIAPFRWAGVDIPPRVSVYVASTTALSRLGAISLAADDPSGASGLLLAGLSTEWGAPLETITVHRPGPSDDLTGRHRPGWATLAPLVGSVDDRSTMWVSKARAGEVVAVAMSPDCVGIDIEQVQTPEQSEDLIALFHPADRRRLRSLDGRRRALGATTIWTRFEALAKRAGAGLRIDPSTVNIGFGSYDAGSREIALTSSGSSPAGDPQTLALDPTGPPPFVISIAV